MTNRRTRSSRADRDPIIRLGDVEVGGGGRSAHLPQDEGPYTFVVDRGVLGTGKDSGQPKIDWRFRVNKGGFKGKTIYHNTSLQPQALFNLKQLMTACGVDPNRPRRASDVIKVLTGKTFSAEVEDDEYNGKVKSIIYEFILEGEEIDEEPDDEEEEDEEEDEDEEEEEEPAPRRRRTSVASSKGTASSRTSSKSKSAAPARTRRRPPVEEDEDDDEDIDDLELDDL